MALILLLCCKVLASLREGFPGNEHVKQQDGIAQWSSISLLCNVVVMVTAPVVMTMTIIKMTTNVLTKKRCYEESNGDEEAVRQLVGVVMYFQGKVMGAYQRPHQIRYLEVVEELS